MKKVEKDSIQNIQGTLSSERKFLFDILEKDHVQQNREIIFMSQLLENRKNSEILEKVSNKPAMYSNVYAPADELEIFIKLYDQAIRDNKKIHIVGLTLDAEIKILEEYYTELGFMREDINCFDVDFSLPLVTASVKIENLMWKGSDYKAMREKIFFCPPVRESGEVKAMFKWINRWVLASIELWDELMDDAIDFLQNSIKQEKILPLTLARVLWINEKQAGLSGIDKELILEY